MARKNHYHSQACIYRSIRPTYPRELFTFLFELVPQAALVWDAGAGNGQAAIGLAEFFPKIVATDESESQIAHAMLHPRVSYRVETSEQTSFQEHTVDLITIGNALHWFPLDLFYREVQRVLRSNGIIAAWCYKIPTFSPEVDRVVHEYDRDIIGSLPQMEYVDREYTTIHFPFQQLDAPTFSIPLLWTMEQLLRYLGSLSAAQVFMEERGFSPTDLIANRLTSIWGGANVEKRGAMPLSLIVGQSPNF